MSQFRFGSISSFARIAAQSAFAALAALLLASGPAEAQSRADARLNALLLEYEQFDRSVDPITSGFEGGGEALSRLPDVTPEAQARSRAALANLAARLEQVRAQPLSAAAQLNRTLLLRLIGERIESLDFDESRMPFGNSGGFFGTGDYLARTTPVRSAADAEAWLARLQALPGYLDANVANARRGVATGFTQPRIVVDRALELARAQRTSVAETLLLPFALQPLKGKAALFPERRLPFREPAERKRLIGERLRPFLLLPPDE